jgi:hypothetical protein
LGDRLRELGQLRWDNKVKSGDVIAVHGWLFDLHRDNPHGAHRDMADLVDGAGGFGVTAADSTETEPSVIQAMAPVSPRNGWMRCAAETTAEPGLAARRDLLGDANGPAIHLEGRRS